MIAALPDARVVITTRRTKVGSVVHEPENFWGFLRSANKPKKRGEWLCYPTLYPDIPRALPSNTSEQMMAALDEARSVVKQGVRCDAATGGERPYTVRYYYKLPKPDEPVLKFKNLNFKLAVMNVLMYEKGLLEPRFGIREFAREYARRRIDPQAEGYDSMIPETAVWFQRYPIPARLERAGDFHSQDIALAGRTT